MDFTEEWCMRLAQLEGDAEVGAGKLPKLQAAVLSVTSAGGIMNIFVRKNEDVEAYEAAVRVYRNPKDPRYWHLMVVNPTGPSDRTESFDDRLMAMGRAMEIALNLMDGEKEDEWVAGGESRLGGRA